MKVVCNRNDECFNETCHHFEEHEKIEKEPGCLDVLCSEAKNHGPCECIPEDELDRIRHPNCRTFEKSTEAMNKTLGKMEARRKPIRFEPVEGE